MHARVVCWLHVKRPSPATPLQLLLLKLFLPWNLIKNLCAMKLHFNVSFLSETASGCSKVRKEALAPAESWFLCKNVQKPFHCAPKREVTFVRDEVVCGRRTRPWSTVSAIGFAGAEVQSSGPGRKRNPRAIIKLIYQPLSG